MQTIESIVISNFPVLYDKDLVAEISSHGVYKQVNEGDTLIEIGSYIKSMPLLIKGTLKIVREDQEGNEILLYFLNGGETCAMSLTCCMSEAISEIRAVALNEVEIILLPVRLMDEWLKKYSSWKNFVMGAYKNRFEELLRTIDSIAFQQMDERLIKYLSDRAKDLGQKIIGITHQEIALDLNSSREVISRLLKRLEQLGKIKLQRNKIEVIDL